MGQPPDRPKERTGGIAQADMAAWMLEFGPGLRRYFAKRAGVADADDLVQEVFLRLAERAAESEVVNVQRYLFTAAHHVLVLRHRKAALRGGLSEPLADDVAGPVDVVDAERILIGRQEYERMIVALQSLPPRAKEAFVFHRFEEMSYGAIARKMGITVIAVRKLVSRAAARIAAVMEGRA